MPRYLVVPKGASARASIASARRARKAPRPGHAPVLTTMAGLASVAGSAWRYVVPPRRVLT